MTAVLLTRPSGSIDSLVKRLAGLGYRVHAVPTVATEPIAVDIADLSGYDWVILTSALGVESLGRWPRGPKWAAVGPATAKALSEKGIEADLVPTESNGRAIAEALPDVNGLRILLARANASAADLPQRLRERGATVDEVATYRTIPGPEGSRKALAEALADPELAAAVFASGSAIEGFVALGGSSAVPAITIGPRTSAAARQFGFQVAAEASAATVNALADAVLAGAPVQE
jgi:uroporphyrinogen-III synthase